MSDELDTTSDVTVGTPSGGAETSAAISPSGDVESGQQTASPSTVVDEGASGASTEFDVPESDEDLKGQENNPHVQEFIKYRQKVRALKTDLTTLEPWKPFSEMGTPDEVKTYAELGKGLLTVVKDGDGNQVIDPATNLPQLTATPGLQMLAQKSPDAFVQMVADALDLTWSDGQGGTTTVRDRVIADTLKQLGLNPANLQRYAEWELKGPPVAQTGLVTPEELSQIDARFHEAFKALPALKRQDLLKLKDSVDEGERQLFDYEMTVAQERFEAAKLFKDQAETRKANEQRQNVEFEQGIQVAKATRISGQFQQGFKSIKDTLASQWKPTSDDAQNQRQYSHVLHTLVNLTDDRMDFDTIPYLQSLGVQNAETELKEMRRLYTAYDSAAERAERAGRQRDAYQVGIAEGESNRSWGLLMARVNGVLAKLVAAQNGVNVLAHNEREKALQGATQGRPVIGANGSSSTAVTSNLPVPLPAGMMPGSPEATDFVMRHFTGS